MLARDAEPRMDQLVRQRGAVGQRAFEITFLDPGVPAWGTATAPIAARRKC